MTAAIDGGTTARRPPLENGDSLTREEFHRRWEAMPRLKRAERIDGVVYLQGRIPHHAHARPHSDIVGWLASYVSETFGVETASSPTVQMDSSNDPQPDAYLLILPERSIGRLPRC